MNDKNTSINISILNNSEDINNVMLPKSDLLYMLPKNIDKPLIIQFANGSSVETIKGGLSIHAKHKVVKLLSEEEVKNIIEKN